VKIRDLMKPVVQTVYSHGNLDDAARVLWEHDCGMVPVVDEESRIHGVITDRDICVTAFVKKQPLSEIAIETAMSKSVHACGPDDEAVAGLKTLAGKKVRRLVVVDDQSKLCGVVSLADYAVACDSREIDPKELAETLAAIAPREPVSG